MSDTLKAIVALSLMVVAVFVCAHQAGFSVLPAGEAKPAVKKIETPKHMCGMMEIYGECECPDRDM